MQLKKSREQFQGGTKVCFLGVYVIMIRSLHLIITVAKAGIIILLLPLCTILAQESSPPDSSALKTQAVPDSSKAPEINQPFTNVRQDSTSKSDIKPANVGLDKPVDYTYKSMITEKTENGRVTRLIGDATVKFGKITIKAGKITIRWNDNLLIAESLPDSGNGANGADSLAVKNTGRPTFSDGKETMVGDRMEFNFKTEKGRILRGRTEFQQGYYQGDAVKRVDPSVFNVADGKYSSCDKEEPHFHFRGKKMKVILNDKVIAKPVIFFIGNIPLAIFPFAMFPTKENGRQSGVIIPQFGTSPAEGRYLQNGGYYWATNDYMDVRFNLDFFEKTGILFRSHVNYKLLYNFSGSVSGSYTRKTISGAKQRRWNLDIRHNQTIDPNTNLSVSGSFVSNNSFYQDFSANRSQRLTRQLRSNATFNKRWSEGRNNISINLSQTKDLENGNNRVTLPQLRFTRGQGAIFPFNKDETGRTKKEPKWYNAIRYSYNGFLLNTVQKDTTKNPDVIDRKAEHDIQLSYTNPNKLFGWLSWSQSFKYDEDWFDRQNSYSLVDSTNKPGPPTEVKGFAARRTFNYSTSASTNLFGTFYPKIGSIRAVRHKMSPSLSFSYRPDFSDNVWGYYQVLEDTSGKELPPLDKFRGTPRGKSMSMNYSLNNLFQMKLGEGEREKKVNLFNLNFSSSYNFAADSLKMQPLTTSFRASPRKNFTVGAGLRHNFYKFDTDSNRVVNRFISPRLTRFNIDARWTLSGKKSVKTDVQNQAAAPTNQGSTLGQQLGQPGLPDQYQDRFSPESAFSALDIPWSATLAFSYNLSKSNPLNQTKRAYLDLSNVQVQLTKNWRIGYRLRYDLEGTEIVDQRISFYRDLHCWEAQFNWNPSGIGRGFYFKINIKAPHLSSVKLEQRGGTTSIFRPF